MRKSNNKGFSLIEVIVAAAVLTILAVPIVKQLAKALQNNATAKERQAAVESADKLLEYFQKTDKLTLDKGGTNEIALTKPAGLSEFQTHTVACSLYDEDGNPISLFDKDGNPVSYIEYNATDYAASKLTLGRSKTDYDQSIVVDDLNNKVMEAGYRISTSAANPGADWITTNENNVVKYDDTHHVVAAIVEKRGDSEPAYLDPNEVNLGYVQDLDATKIAIIAGDEISLDEQFNDDVYNTVLASVLKNKDKIPDATWSELTDHVVIGDYEGTQLDYNIKRVSTETSRVLYVNLSYEEAAMDPHYVVKVEAFYSTLIYALSVNGVSLAPEQKAVYHYPIYEKEFYTKNAQGEDVPPDIYMIYEPLLRVYSGVTSYVTDDYIVTSYEDDALENADACNFYLVKSAEPSLKDTYVDGNKFISYFNGDNETKIHVVSVAKDDSSNKPMHVYTNIATTPVNPDSAISSYELLADEKEAHFSVDLGIPSDIENNVEFKNDVMTAGLNFKAYSYDDISAVNAGERTEARLYTVRVTLENSKTHDRLYLTGAKGAD